MINNMKKIFYWSDKNLIDRLKAVINRDNIVITSTDTILGFLGNITKKSFDKIVKIKGKREDKPFLIMVDSLEKLHKFVDSRIFENKALCQLLEKHWPGPLTVIFKGNDDLASFLKSKNNTVAIRCPNHVGLQSILKYYDGLFSTSANKTGLSVPKNYKEIDPDIIKLVEFVLVQKEEIDTKSKLYNTLPSTIIDVSNFDVKVVRRGAYPIKELEKTYGTKFKE